MNVTVPFKGSGTDEDPFVIAVDLGNVGWRLVRFDKQTKEAVIELQEPARVMNAIDITGSLVPNETQAAFVARRNADFLEADRRAREAVDKQMV